MIEHRWEEIICECDASKTRIKLKLNRTFTTAVGFWEILKSEERPQ